jgi:ATP-dependent Lhr-like helicase
MSIGTIVSDASIHLKFWSKGGGGKQLGSVEEGFIARLKPGDGFLFAGRLLELVRVENMTRTSNAAPRKSRRAALEWRADAAFQRTGRRRGQSLHAAARGEFVGPEMLALQLLLQTQARWSGLPTSDSLLAEVLKSREGWHLFLYPFAGRQVHLGSPACWRGA